MLCPIGSKHGTRLRINGDAYEPIFAALDNDGRQAWRPSSDAPTIPWAHGGYVPVVPVKEGHGARGSRGMLWRAKQKAAIDGRGLEESRDAGCTLLLALKDAFEVLEFLAVRTDLPTG